MAISLETLAFAKESVKHARLKSEELIAEMAPDIAKLNAPLEQRIVELRGFVRGLLCGQETVLNRVLDLVPPTSLSTLIRNAQQVTAPETHWSNKFHQSLDPLMNGERKSQERAEKFLAELAKRVRDLVVWEGVLDQLIAKATTPIAPKKPAAIVKQQKITNDADFELETGSSNAAVPDGSTGDLTEEIRGTDDKKPSDSKDDSFGDIELGEFSMTDDTPSGNDLKIDVNPPNKKK